MHLDLAAWVAYAKIQRPGAELAEQLRGVPALANAIRVELNKYWIFFRWMVPFVLDCKDVAMPALRSALTEMASDVSLLA